MRSSAPAQRWPSIKRFSIVTKSRAGFLLTAGAFAAAPAIAQGALTVRVAAAPSDTFGEAYYADQQGFFKDAGLNVELTTLGNGGAIATAIGSGTIDVGITNALTLAGAVVRGVPFVFLASGGLYNPAANQLCVPETSPIRTAKDLGGKAIAVSSLRGTEWLSVQAWIDKNGGDSTTVKLLEIPYIEIGPAALRGAIAGGMLTEPYLTAERSADRLRAIATPFDVFGPHLMISGWFTTRTWLAANALAAKRFVQAMYATAKWANAHHEDTAQILARVAKLDLATLRTMNRCPYGETLVRENVQTAYDYAYKYKVFERPVDAREVIAGL
jgi:NitT/TauT family transport system substrate-binding protein